MSRLNKWRTAEVNKQIVWRYTRNGILFGLTFPVIATIWEVISQGLQLSIANIMLIHMNEPLLWMINTAPFFLGVFAFFAGRNQLKAARLNAELRMRVRERDRIVDELSTLRNSQELNIEKQIAQLQATAQVAREATSSHNLNQILTSTVNLISEQFGFYHIGIFLIEENGNYAVLRAANSEEGRRMLSRQHKLEVGQVGIVGYVASSGKPRIVLDVGQDGVFFDNPDLPLTRSEMALPMKVQDRVIAVLDVQSVQPEAFNEQDLAILQTLADQVALAIENTRLLSERQQALEELESSYSRQIHLAWQKRLANRPIAYTYEPSGIRAAQASELGGVSNETNLLSVPIRLRGQEIGSLKLRRNGTASPWTPEDRELVAEVVNQIALALENARLIDEIQQRAVQEQLVSQISQKTQSSLDLEAVMKAAVQEIGRAVGASKVQIRLAPEKMSAGQSSSFSSQEPSRS